MHQDDVRVIEGEQRQEAKIQYLELPFVVQQQIMGLDLEVGDSIGVAKLERCDELLKVVVREALFERAVAGYLGEEITALGILHREIDLGLGGYDFVKLDDVGVALRGEGSEVIL
ncbi:hypothetical protein ACLOJK_003918 [Asimina triloba]